MASTPSLDPGFVSFVTKQLNQLPVLLPIIRRLHIQEIVDKHCPMERETDLSHGLALEILVLNRFMAPKPLYKVEEWLQRTAVLEAYQGFSGTADLPLPLTPERFNDDRLARALEEVAAHIAPIENEIALEAITAFQLKSRIVHFDLTSIYFEGRYEEAETIRHGYSRDHRPDAVQANIGLDVVGEGCPIGHGRYAGNQSDSTAALKNLQRLKERLDRSDLILVGDQGSLTAENIVQLEQQGDGYIGRLRLGESEKVLICELEEEEEEPFTPLDYVSRSRSGGTFSGVEVEVSIETEKGAEPIAVRGLVVESEVQVKKDNRRRERYLRKHRGALAAIEAKLNQRKYKDPCYVRQQVDSALKGTRYRYLWQIVVQGEYGAVELSYRLDAGKVRRDQQLAGKYLIVTNVGREELDRDELFRVYKAQYVVDARFRNLKTDLGVRPIYLEKEERIEGLIFAVILALMVYCLLEIVWRRRGKRYQETGRRLLEWFEGVEVGIFRYRGGRKAWRVGELGQQERRILRGLRFPFPETYVDRD